MDKTRAGSDILDTRNILDSVLAHLRRKNRSPINSVFDLSELIMTRCLGLNFDQVEREHERYPYLEIFDYSVNYVVSIACNSIDSCWSLLIGTTRQMKRFVVSTILQTEEEGKPLLIDQMEINQMRSEIPKR